ncbi:MAG TPA: hydrolase [Leeuwenhoekiella sp.]|nr:hydrolase [Leeuwenhoekiella sp.]
MRRHIFMYLFFFAALWIIFQYANEKKIFGAQETKIANLQERLKKAEDSLRTIGDQSADNSYFGLEGNENAYTYFDKFDVPVEGLQAKIEDAVISKNTTDGNPLIPFQNANRIFRINKVKVLNHKWILADFTDGKRWGELLLGYSIASDGSIDFQNLESLIYPIY